MTEIHVSGDAPATLGTKAFDNTNECPIYVPSAAVEAYKTAWSAYASRIQAEITVGVNNIKVLALVVFDVEAGLALRLQTQRLMKQMVAQTQLLCLDLRIQRFDSKHYLFSFLLLSQIHDIIPVFCFFWIQY